jgi:outer membrane protein assembly factor BamB
MIVTTDAGGVRAVDVHGRTRWAAEVRDLLDGVPALDGDIVLVGGQGRVVALARRDGRRRWEHPMRGEVTSVALGGGLALAGDEHGDLVALDVASGVPRWSFAAPGTLVSAPRVVAESGVVVAIWQYGATPAVRALDLATGALRWSAPVGLFTAAPLVAGGLVVVAEGDGDYHARVQSYALGTGEPRWGRVAPASYEPAIEPAADGRDVALVDHLGTVVLVDRASGRLRWQRALDRGVLSTRVFLTRRRVVLTTSMSEVWVLDRRSGRVLAHERARELGGVPFAVVVARWPGRARVLVALRLARPFRVEARPLP